LKNILSIFNWPDVDGTYATSALVATWVPVAFVVDSTTAVVPLFHKISC